MLTFLRRLANSWSRTPPRGAPDQGAVTLRLPLQPGGENSIQQILSEIGLPWQVSRAEVQHTYGVRPDPAYCDDVILLDTPTPLVDGLLQPLSAQAAPHFAPGLPIIRFTGRASFGGNAHDNLPRAAAGLAARLGYAQIERSANTLTCSWACGAASVGLTAWPVEWQPAAWENVAHRRDPRLISACFVTVLTGFRPELTPEEEGWLDGFVSIARIKGSRDMTPQRLRCSPAVEHELEFVREPPARIQHLFRQMGRSAGGEALIFCLAQLYIIPVSVIRSFEVDRVLPAKGGGGSSLMVECTTGDSTKPTKRITVATAGDANGLNGTGAALARALNKPLILGEYGYDV